MSKTSKKSTTSYCLKKPLNGRVSFSIIKVTSYYQDGKRIRENKTIQDTRLNSLNNEFANRKIDFNEAVIQAEKIRSSFSTILQDTNHTIPEANRSLIKRYLIHYKSKRNSLDITVKNLEYNLARLMRVLKDEKFESLKAEDIFSFIEESDNSIDGKNRMLIVSNMLFKYLRRTEDLFQKKIKSNGKHKINFITEEELKIYLNKEKDEVVKAYVFFLFYTGLRIGELKGLDDSDFNDNFILVARQLTRHSGEQDTKNNKNRAVLLLEGVIDSWQVIKENQKSHSESSRIIRASISKQINRDISAHDLRHSYAMFLRSKKFDITDIAQLLGNRVDVCMKHYAGFSLHTNKIEELIKKIS